MPNSESARYTPHDMLQDVASVIVICAGLFLLALGITCLLKPLSAVRFLMAFASTPTKHYLELLVRVLVGVSLLTGAPRMAWPTPFIVLGWLLIATTAVLAVVPWHKHRDLAARLVPIATSHLAVLGLASAGLGIAVIHAITCGAA